jgi:DNA-binding PucR family transcriptional regulator
VYKLKSKISKTEIKIIFALAECGLNSSRAARKLNFHRNTVVYHIGEIKNITGLDPLDFHDMVKLLRRFKEEKE